MRQRLMTFIIITVGNFVLSYRFLENENLIRLGFMSALLGLGFAFIEGRLRKVSDFLFRKILKKVH